MANKIVVADQIIKEFKPNINIDDSIFTLKGMGVKHAANCLTTSWPTVPVAPVTKILLFMMTP